MLNNFISYDVLQYMHLIVFTALLIVKEWRMPSIILLIGCICNLYIADALTELVQFKHITWEFYGVWAFVDAVFCGLLLSQESNSRGVRLQIYVLGVASILHLVYAFILLLVGGAGLPPIMRVFYSNSVWVLTVLQLAMGAYVIPYALGAVGRFVSDLSRPGGLHYIRGCIVSNMEKYIKTHKKISP